MAGSPGGRPSARRDAGDLRFRVTDLRRHPGARHEERRVVQVEPQRIGDAAASGEAVELDVELESLSDGVRVLGSVGYDWTGSCRRCLEEAEGRASAEIRELFVDDPDLYESDADEEVHRITEGWVDLSDVVRDAVGLGLPLAPLCRDDCEGPAPESFPVSIEGDPEDLSAREDDDAAPGDPRWGPLSELRFDRDRD